MRDIRTAIEWIVLLLFAGPSAVQAQSVAPSRERLEWLQVDPSLRAAMPDSVRTRLRDSLALGRMRWRAYRPVAYRLAVTLGCFCPPTSADLAGASAVVQGVQIVGVERAPAVEGGKDGMLRWEIWTVDSLFAHAERDLNNPRVAVSTMELDPQYGFPTRIVSTAPGITDSGSAVEVRYFRPQP